MSDQPDRFNPYEFRDAIQDGTLPELIATYPERTIPHSASPLELMAYTQCVTAIITGESTGMWAIDETGLVYLSTPWEAVLAEWHARPRKGAA